MGTEHQSRGSIDWLTRLENSPVNRKMCLSCERLLQTDGKRLHGLRCQTRSRARKRCLFGPITGITGSSAVIPLASLQTEAARPLGVVCVLRSRWAPRGVRAGSSRGSASHGAMTAAGRAESSGPSWPRWRRWRRRSEGNKRDTSDPMVYIHPLIQSGLS